MSLGIRILLDSFVLLTFLVPTARGVYMGFFRSALRFLRYLIAALLAFLVASALAGMLAPIAAVVTFFLFSLLLIPLLSALLGRVVQRLPVIKQADRVLGLLLGGCIGLLIASISAHAIGTLLMWFTELDPETLPILSFFRDACPLPGLVREVL